MTNSLPDIPRPLLARHVGCFYRVLSVMEERSEDFREALSNIARRARSLLQNFSDSNVQSIEQRMLDQRPRESGILSTRTQSSSQTVAAGFAHEAASLCSDTDSPPQNNFGELNWLNKYN